MVKIWAGGLMGGHQNVTGMGWRDDLLNCWYQNVKGLDWRAYGQTPECLKVWAGGLIGWYQNV